MSQAIDKIKEYLKEQDRTMTWLARQLGTSRQVIKYWMSGDRLPNVEMRRKLKEMFDLKDDWV